MPINYVVRKKIDKSGKEPKVLYYAAPKALQKAAATSAFGQRKNFPFSLSSSSLLGFSLVQRGAGPPISAVPIQTPIQTPMGLPMGMRYRPDGTIDTGPMGLPMRLPVCFVAGWGMWH